MKMTTSMILLKKKEDDVFESPLVDEQEQADDLTEETAADGGEVKELGRLPLQHKSPGPILVV